MVESGAKTKTITDEMIRIGRIILIVLGLIWSGFISCGKQFIFLWAGQDNIDAYYVAVILMTSYIFVLTESIGTQILWAMNQHKEQAIMKCVIVLLNILLTIVLIKWKPLIGATLGTFISLTLGDIVVMNVIFHKKLKMNLWYYYKGLAKGVLPSIAITVLSGFAVNFFLKSGGWLFFIIKIAIICLVYAVCMLLFGMSNYEKKFLLSFFKNSK
jgi:O-antigen/teichoic acid export membrane protein